MDYRTASVWIICIVMVLYAMLFLFGTPGTVFLILIAAPVLVAWQAYTVLTAKDSPDKTFDEDWYENK